MNRGDSRVLHLCVENDALVTNGLKSNVVCASKAPQGKLSYGDGAILNYSSTLCNGKMENKDGGDKWSIQQYSFILLTNII